MRRLSGEHALRTARTWGLSRNPAWKVVHDHCALRARITELLPAVAAHAAPVTDHGRPAAGLASTLAHLAGSERRAAHVRPVGRDGPLFGRAADALAHCSEEAYSAYRLDCGFPFFCSTHPRPVLWWALSWHSCTPRFTNRELTLLVGVVVGRHQVPLFNPVPWLDLHGVIDKATLVEREIVE